MEKHNRFTAGVINVTNAIPKRVLLISEELRSHFRVEFICWNRFSISNVDNAVFIHAKTLLGYLGKLVFLLFTKKYKILLFDDLRLLPFVGIIGNLTKTKLIYNRMEVPTISAAGILRKRLGLSRRISIIVSESFETFFSRFVNGILTIPLADNDLLRLKDWNKPIAVMWNVPEKSTVKEPRSIRIRKIGRPAILIYSGSVAEENGLISYLRLIRHLNEIGGICSSRLIIVGRLWKLTKKRLRSLIKEECCQDFVAYHDWIPYDKLLYLLDEADIGLALADPSFEKYTHMTEGASRKIFTYMAAGLPVVGGGMFGSILAKEGAGYFVDYDNFDALTNAVMKILSDPTNAYLIGEFGRKAILDKFNWEIERNKFVRLLLEVLS